MPPPNEYDVSTGAGRVSWRPDPDKDVGWLTISIPLVDQATARRALVALVDGELPDAVLGVVTG